MKHLRKPLALLLALLIAFGLGASSAAEEIELEAETVTEAPMVVSEAVTETTEEPAEIVEAAMETTVEAAEAPMTASAVNWEDFTIITHPPESLSVKHGESFTLSVEVNIPEGVEMEYQWYCESNMIPGATDAVLQVNRDDAVHPKNYANACTYYYCRITGVEKKDGIEVSREWQNSASSVVDMKTMKKTMGKLLEPIAEAFLVALIGGYFGPAQLVDGLSEPLRGILSYFLIPFIPLFSIYYFFRALLFPNSIVLF